MFKNVLELSKERQIIKGSQDNLIRSIKNGADLRIYTEFRHNQHVDISSENDEIVKEVSEFPATYVVEDKWCAGIMTLRQPVTLPSAFGPRASMSFFMYNMDGTQAVARPFLDGKGPENENPEAVCESSYFHELGKNDQDTNAPSRNFIYDFSNYKYYVNECFEEVYANNNEGICTFGSLKKLTDAAIRGSQIKIAINGLCDHFCSNEPVSYEIIIQTGPTYFYTDTNYLITESHPFVRVNPQIPMRYESGKWDFGWVIARTDGHVAGLWYNPYTLKTTRTNDKLSIRWFVKK